MAFHACRTGGKAPVSCGCAAVAGENWKGGHGRVAKEERQGHKMRLERVRFLSDGGRQTLYVAAVDFVSERVAVSAFFFFFGNGVLTFAADQQAVLGTVLEQITCAESDGRRDRSLEGHPHLHIGRKELVTAHAVLDPLCRQPISVLRECICSISLLFAWKESMMWLV